MEDERAVAHPLSLNISGQVLHQSIFKFMHTNDDGSQILLMLRYISETRPDVSEFQSMSS